MFFIDNVLTKGRPKGQNIINKAHVSIDDKEGYNTSV